MNKISLILYFIITFTGNIIGQNDYFNINYTKTFDDVKPLSVVRGLHISSKGNLALIRTVPRGLVFDIFNDNTKHIFTKYVEISKNENFIGELFYNSELKVFTVEIVKRKTKNYYCYTLGPDTKTYKKTFLYNTEVFGKKSNSYKIDFGEIDKPYEIYRIGHLDNIAVSANEKFLVFYNDKINKNTNAYELHVFDLNLNPVFSESVKNNENSHFELIDLAMDDNGNVYTMGKLYEKGSREKKNGKANYNYILNKVNASSIESLIISLEDQLIETMQFAEKGRDIYLLGFYSENKVNKIKGITVFKLDNNNFKTLSKKNIDFPKEIYSDIYGDYKVSKKEKKKNELENFNLDYVLEDDNGNIYMVAEKFYISNNTTWMNSSNRTFGTFGTYGTFGTGTVGINGTGMTGGGGRPVPNYDDILVLKFNDKGDLLWGRSLVKKANSSSYNVFINNNKLHILLNSGKNLKEKSDGRTVMSYGIFLKTGLYNIVFDDNGEMEYDMIRENTSTDYFLPVEGDFQGNKFIMLDNSDITKRFLILEAK